LGVGRVRCRGKMRRRGRANRGFQGRFAVVVTPVVSQGGGLFLGGFIKKSMNGGRRNLQASKRWARGWII
jgi:hypothetical protein